MRKWPIEMARSEKMPTLQSKSLVPWELPGRHMDPRQDYILGLKKKRGFCFLVDLIIFQRLVLAFSCWASIGLAKKFVWVFLQYLSEKSEQMFWPTQYLWIKTYHNMTSCWCLPDSSRQKSTRPGCISLASCSRQYDDDPAHCFICLFLPRDRAGSLSHSTSSQIPGIWNNAWNKHVILQSVCTGCMYRRKNLTPRSFSF